MLEKNLNLGKDIFSVKTSNSKRDLGTQRNNLYILKNTSEVHLTRNLYIKKHQNIERRS